MRNDDREMDASGSDTTQRRHLSTANGQCGKLTRLRHAHPLSRLILHNAPITNVQAISGVSPAAIRETTVMVVWPSICAGPWGRWLGRLYSLRAGVTIAGVPLTVGWAIAIASIPLALLLYFDKKVPRIPLVLLGWSNPSCRRYRLTNRRVLVEHPFEGTLLQSIALEGFDAINVHVLPGQEWYDAGDLVFLQNGVERLRLSGVNRPEPFRQSCLKAQQALVSVRACVSL